MTPEEMVTAIDPRGQHARPWRVGERMGGGVVVFNARDGFVAGRCPRCEKRFTPDIANALVKAANGGEHLFERTRVIRPRVSAW